MLRDLLEAPWLAAAASHSLKGNQGAIMPACRHAPGQLLHRLQQPKAPAAQQQQPLAQCLQAPGQLRHLLQQPKAPPAGQQHQQQPLAQRLQALGQLRHLLQQPRLCILLPHRAIFKELLLPDGHRCLELIDRPVRGLGCWHTGDKSVDLTSAPPLPACAPGAFIWRDDRRAVLLQATQHHTPAPFPRLLAASTSACSPPLPHMHPPRGHPCGGGRRWR